MPFRATKNMSKLFVNIDLVYCPFKLVLRGRHLTADRFALKSIVLSSSVFPLIKSLPSLIYIGPLRLSDFWNYSSFWKKILVRLGGAGGELWGGAFFPIKPSNFSPSPLLKREEKRGKNNQFFVHLKSKKLLYKL